MIDKEIKEFLEKYAAGSHSDEGHLQFTGWIKTAPFEAVEEAAAYYEQVSGNKTLPLAHKEELVAKIEAALNQYDLAKAHTIKQSPRIFSLKSFQRIAAAAVLLLIASGAWLYFNNRNAQQVSSPQLAKVNDIAAPASSKAMITLADGRTVVLDSVLNGTVAMQNDVTVVKNTDGEIVYQPTANGTDPMAIAYNTLYNPRGSKVINLTLGDGSKVWLNAESSLRYPVAFAGNERKVEITGEAYFEVSPSPSKGGVKRPFIVKKGDMEVTVLGTHFNVNTYEDEKELKVTLLEGSVSVSQKAETKILKPGQQAVLNNGSIAINNSVDLDAVMAWKNGLFNFNNADLQMVLLQLARWYDVEVLYQGTIPQRSFGGEIQRDLNLLNVLKILEKNNVHFKIDGKKLIVTP